MSDSKNKIAEELKRFNRKERYWLLNNVLDNFAGQKINAEFSSAIESKLNIKIPKSGVYWALDYHLDWVYAAITSIHQNNSKGEYPNDDRLKVRGTQQDIDFLIAFDETIIFVEAKGVTGWIKDQLMEKIVRIGEIQRFLSKHSSYNLYFVLISPDRTPENSLDLLSRHLPSEVKYAHYLMEIDKDLHYVQRFNPVANKNNEYSNWKILPPKTEVRSANENTAAPQLISTTSID